jgi:MFS family permease
MAGAMIADSVPAYLLVFVALGGANAVTIIADPNMSIEFAPPDRTSLYLGTTSTLLAPFFVLGPLIAGVAAGALGYPVVFAAAGVLAIAGVLLALRVKEPRRVAIVEAYGQPGALP